SFFFQAEEGIRNRNVTGVQTCALPICRVHRYKGHAVRKNVAAAHAGAAFASADADPWEAAFDAARAEVVGPDGDSGNGGPDGLRPYWVFTGASNAESARIERYVPAMPLSKEEIGRAHV